MNLRGLAAAAMTAGALGLGAFSLGIGTAQADDGNRHGCWPLPCDAFQGPPGQNPFGPPGQVKKDAYLGPIPNPVYGVPPGHWDDVPVWWGQPR